MMRVSTMRRRILLSQGMQAQALQGLAPHQQFAIAKAQVEGVTDMFNRMADLCFKQCIHKFKEPELNVGEMSCIDRCVGKFLATQEKAGTKIADFNTQMQAMQMAAMQQAQQQAQEAQARQQAGQ